MRSRVRILPLTLLALLVFATVADALTVSLAYDYPEPDPREEPAAISRSRAASDGSAGVKRHRRPSCVRQPATITPFSSPRSTG